MKSFVLIGFLCAGLLACQGSGEPSSTEYPAATGDGARRAYIDEVDQLVQGHRQSVRSPRVMVLSDELIRELNCRCAGAEELQLFRSESALQFARLASGDAILKEYHFGARGKLQYALTRSDSKGEAPLEFYFVNGGLLLARQGRQQLSVDEEAIKYQSILIVNEARQIRDLPTSQTIEP